MNFSPPVQLTPNNAHHFFGYFGISPWSRDERYFLYLETTFHDHMPKYGQSVKIIKADLRQNCTECLTETLAWNFQQGCMLHWLPSNPNHKIIYNDLENHRPISKILNVETKEARTLPRAINALGQRSDIALCLNFARYYRNRRVISYPTEWDYSSGSHPNDDGIFLMDLNTGETKLIISFDQIWKMNPISAEIPEDELGGREMWIDHVGFNPSDSRLFFLARYANWFKGLETSMWTINPDGTDPHLVADFGHSISHFGWFSDQELIVTMKPDLPNGQGISKHHQHVRIMDKTKESHIIASKELIHDGHPTLHPTGKWMATDTYPINGTRYIYTVDLSVIPETVHQVASFVNPKEINFDIRCDPHPRWNPSGSKLCYDGLGPNGRQIYVVDVLEI